jgi:AhpD family alkylhydroperoxidase
MAMVAKKHYSVHQTYWIIHDAARTVRHFARLRSRGKRFTERIMLAVTEVNGCALCAYGHTRVALQAGLSDGEIRELLAGEADGVPDAELPAIVFAQHYADTRGRPEHDVWEGLVDVYRDDQALGILGTARMIMWGNAVGIPWSSLLSRLRGAPEPGSSIGYEVGTIMGATLVTPVAVTHAAISSVRRTPII